MLFYFYRSDFSSQQPWLKSDPIKKGPAFFLPMVEIVAGIIGVLAIPSKFLEHTGCFSRGIAP
jgi:hypothetical protein